MGMIPSILYLISGGWTVGTLALNFLFQIFFQISQTLFVVQVCEDIQAILRIQGAEVFKTSVNRPNLFYEVKRTLHNTISKRLCSSSQAHSDATQMSLIQSSTLGCHR